MAAEAALEPNQEFLEACMPSASSIGQGGVPPRAAARSATTTSGGSTARDLRRAEAAVLLYDGRRVSDGCAHVRELCIACVVVSHVASEAPRRGGGGEVPVRCAALSRTSTATATPSCTPEDCKN
uniref:Uncharacterized protein n=2 Tax=Oryza TaxID=4527 RepID=A0A0D3H781_9ORYZ